MYDHLKRLISVSNYAAPHDRPITPVQIPENNELVEFITAGKVFFSWQDEERTFERGTLFWHHPGEYTVHRTPSDAPYRCTVFRFEVSAPRRPGERVGVWENTGEALDFADTAFREFHAGSARLDAFAAYIYSTLAWHVTAPRRQPLTPRPKVLKSAQNFLEAHLAEPLSTLDAAQASGVSLPYLFTLFRKHLGTSPHQYLLRLRLDKARLLLADAAVPIKEVAAACGFDSLEVFYRQFRRDARMTPAEYRRKYAAYPRH